MKNKSLLAVLLLLVGLVSITSCKEEPFATITPKNANADGDVVGDGGTATATFNWENALTTAALNMDITASKGGKLQIIVKDANGTEVINATLEKGVGDDSKGVCSSAGVAGTWTVTVTATNFNGDASYSLDQGC